MILSNSLQKTSLVWNPWWLGWNPSPSQQTNPFWHPNLPAADRRPCRQSSAPSSPAFCPASRATWAPFSDFFRKAKSAWGGAEVRSSGCVGFSVRWRIYDGLQVVRRWSAFFLNLRHIRKEWFNIGYGPLRYLLVLKGNHNHPTR